MKTTIAVLIILIGIQGTALAQCGIDYQELLAKQCSGVYLQHRELDNSNDKMVTFMFKKGNKYALYLLNPSQKLPTIKLDQKDAFPGVKFKTQLNTNKNYSKSEITVNEDGEYHFKLNFGASSEACVLMAIYLQNGNQFQAGLYRTFDEFKYNNPSEVNSYEITTRIRSLGKEESQVFQLNVSRKEGKAFGRVFGFSDGINFYINYQRPTLKSKVEFVKIDIIGDYGYFEEIQNILIEGITYEMLQPLLIDRNTGELYNLNRKRLREIIADDATLLAEFNNETRKDKVLKTYLFKYAGRHKE